MEVNVSPEIEKRLTEMASQTGARVADYAGFLLERQVREKADESRVNGLKHFNGADEGDDDTDPDALAHALAELFSETPEEAEQARAELLAASRPPRPLPKGKTLADMVYGQWPGDETDEQVLEALRKLS